MCRLFLGSRASDDVAARRWMRACCYHDVSCDGLLRTGGWRGHVGSAGSLMSRPDLGESAALRNLLTNAERHGGPHVVATISSGHGQTELTVRDDGQGIAADRRDRIFEPYEHGHGRSGMTQSIGIGLAVSRQLAGLMKGDLTYRFERGWNVFALTLPAVQPQSDTDGERSG